MRFSMPVGTSHFAYAVALVILASSATFRDARADVVGMRNFLFEQIQMALDSTASDAIALTAKVADPLVQRQIDNLEKKIAQQKRWMENGVRALNVELEDIAKLPANDRKPHEDRARQQHEEARAYHQGEIDSMQGAIAEMRGDLTTDKKAGLLAITFDQVQEHLRPDEALVFIGHYRADPRLAAVGTNPEKILPHMNSDPTFRKFGFEPNAASDEAYIVWVVTKSDVAWRRVSRSTAEFTREVDVLRCGLDRSSWRRGTICKDHFGQELAKGQALPFDAAAAHTLYREIFGPFADLIKDRALILVPMGPLTQVPLHVLMTERTDTTQTSGWLASSHAIVVLPSVANFVALREGIRPSQAKLPFIGFGNPTLEGSSRCRAISVPDKCPSSEDAVGGGDAQEEDRSIAASDEVIEVVREGVADSALLKKLCPLPDTAHELKCVAKTFGEQASTVLLGPEMTETSLKSSPLNEYRVVHFATHGLLTAETARVSDAVAEPAIVMSPPDMPTKADDGLLTMSEIAELKLDADWVVLSACNTAGAGGKGGEALSGLAQAFFSAGARSLLASHWAVDSNAATLLTTRAFAELEADKAIGKAEAFRRAMLSYMKIAPHPSKWAPFVLVGEGH